jgi:pimeloyl-ACP methyl ester carboxylesterase
MFMPFQVLGMFLRGLLSLAILVGGVALLGQWYKHREHVVVEPVSNVVPSASELVPNERTRTRTRDVRWRWGVNRETALLVSGVALVGWSLGGGFVAYPLLWRRRENNATERKFAGEVHHLKRPDGSELEISISGRVDSQPMIFIHGWGLDKNEWCYAQKELSGHFKLIAWDLPGLGGSTRPKDRDWSLEKLAGHLDAIISFAGNNKPVILVGHSIGVMICLTFCRLFPGALGIRVAKIILVHGTYTNPVRTTSNAWLHTALQKPLLEPLCHLMIWLSPLFRMMNWISYINGSAHRSTERDSFSGNETRGQLDFITRYYCKAAPNVVARGMLAMFQYDATETLASINVPTLVVAGRNDKTCTLEASRHMAATIPQAELLVIESAKHCGLVEHHEQWKEAVLSFTADNSREAQGGGKPKSMAGT